jgi:hypothetical protein
MSLGLRIFGAGIILVVAGALVFGRRRQHASSTPVASGHEAGI